MTKSAREVTCSAPVNIAVVKYWGKRDTHLILPTNSSLSVTLSQDTLKSTTTIRFAQTDAFYLNGTLQPPSKRLEKVIQSARELRAAMETEGVQKWSVEPLEIVSVNNFPTAAGLASSASGFACLVFALAELFQLDIDCTHLSRLARLGSGSACRSLFGGFVAWEMGLRDDGLDSVAVQVAPESHWHDLEALVLVVSESRKETGSTEGMQLTVQTSALLTKRIEIVPERMAMMKQAILAKDFDTFAQLTMMDSNSFHAVCLDTFPPVFYMNDVSRLIIRLVNAYNALFVETRCGKSTGYRAAYTFDAGPNAVIYLPREHVPELLALVNHFFPTSKSGEYVGRAASFLGHTAILERVGEMNMSVFQDGLDRIISASIGDGPRVLATEYVPSISLLPPQ